MTNITKYIDEFHKHLSKSAPSMDKFEKASALNFLRTTLQSKEQLKEEGV